MRKWHGTFFPINKVKIAAFIFYDVVRVKKFSDVFYIMSGIFFIFSLTIPVIRLTEQLSQYINNSYMHLFALYNKGKNHIIYKRSFYYFKN
jgi:hypothetical protein